MPRSRVSRVNSGSWFELKSYSKSWPCLFPQHGPPGKNYERPTVLAPWQRALVSEALTGFSAETRPPSGRSLPRVRIAPWIMSRWWGQSHPVFRLLLCASLAAVAAAVLVDVSPRPGVALGSEVLHRLVVGFCVLAVVYAILMVLWLAYQGRWASMQVPGVGAGIQPADEIDQAAADLDEYQRDTRERLGAHERALQQLRDRVSALEQQPPGSDSSAGSSELSPG